MKVSNILYISTFLIALLAFFLSPYLLASFGINYADGVDQNFFAKVHPYSYVILSIFSLCVFFLSPKVSLYFGPLKLAWVFFIVSIVAVFLRGKVAGSSIFVDTLFTPLLLFPIILRFSDVKKKNILDFLTILMLLNACTAMLEYVLGASLWGPDRNSQYFRATAWLNHPLNNALIMASLFPVLMKNGRMNSIFYFSITLASLIAFGARAATAIFLLFSVPVFLKEGAEKKGGTFRGLKMLHLLLMGVCILIMAYVSNFGARIFENLLIDDSAQTRITALSAFSLLSFNDILWGLSAAFQDGVNEVMGVSTIENFYIGWVLRYGLVGALPVLAAFMFFMYKVFRLGDSALKCSVLSFLLIASTNNSLNSKTSSFLFFIIVVACSLFSESKDPKVMGR